MNTVASSIPVDTDTLVGHFRKVARERMQGLPIVNPRLTVEAVDDRPLGDHAFCVLITPWFMNMIVLPGTSEWSRLPRGESVTVALPAADYEFTVCRDDELDGCYLSAVLFRSMTDFPDQTTARDVAAEVARQLFVTPPDDDAGKRETGVTRRDLFALRGGDV